MTDHSDPTPMPVLPKPIVVNPVTVLGSRMFAASYCGLLGTLALRDGNFEHANDLLFTMGFMAVLMSPLLILASMLGSEASFHPEFISVTNFVGRTKRYSWSDLTSVYCASGRGTSRRMILRFGRKGPKIEIGNGRRGFWMAADYLKDAAEEQPWNLDYGLLGLGGIDFWLSEDLRDVRWL